MRRQLPVKDFFHGNMKPLKFEVDLPMLPVGSTAADLGPFCKALERVCEEGGDDLVRIVATFRADNRDANLGWGWPTVDQWNLAVERHYGVRVLYPNRQLR